MKTGVEFVSVEPKVLDDLFGEEAAKPVRERGSSHWHTLRGFAIPFQFEVVYVDPSTAEYDDELLVAQASGERYGTGTVRIGTSIGHGQLHVKDQLHQTKRFPHREGWHVLTIGAESGWNRPSDGDFKNWVELSREEPYKHLRTTFNLSEMGARFDPEALTIEKAQEEEFYTVVEALKALKTNQQPN